MRKFSVEFFERFAKFINHDNYVDFVMSQLRLCSQDEENFWPKFESYLFSLITPLKKLKNCNENT